MCVATTAERRGRRLGSRRATAALFREVAARLVSAMWRRKLTGDGEMATSTVIWGSAMAGCWRLHGSI
uniref:Uncharacterized protein n=1 Tax=Oryza sativa subsp. japonica TaxID=39947 RepID=Q67VW1_ORYSJ|nr:hypothetical protein [Oryza sativa Japonica Group]